ncbi:MAG: hypothetical protein AAFX78_08665 [Cyanobacteria bacterium J06638_20]
MSLQDDYHGEVDPDAGLDQYHGDVDPDAGVDEYHGEPDLSVEEVAPQSPTAMQQIGPAIDCDLDGDADDARMDYDGDGIPEECVIY